MDIRDGPAGAGVSSLAECVTDAPEEWARGLVGALREVPLDLAPIDTRRALRDRAGEYARRSRTMPSHSLVLVFGSVARGEVAHDLDLILVHGDAQPHHRYWRLAAERSDVDLNVASEAWLRDAWQDAEYGYWLNESYVLHRRGAGLLATWKRACNLYWSPAGVSRRARHHRTMARQLVDAHVRASSEGLVVLSRLLGHEAARAAACALIDRYGARVFSHRTFIAELRAAAGAGGLPMAATSALLCALTAGRARDELAFYRLRRCISGVLRSLHVTRAAGLDAGAPRVDRVEALCRTVDGSAGRPLEEALLRGGAGGMLPTTAQLAGLRACVEAVLESICATRRVPLLQKLALPVRSVPRNGDTPGARWVSCDAGRLKVIVNTGGCKTASCSFCALPAFGRSAARADVAATLASALQRHPSREVALYNDGNLLNPREVSAEDLTAACAVLRRHRVERLTIETVPRFVTREAVADVRIRSGVARLTVALGLQVIGNAFAVEQLGRPDVDALFDFAIDEIHDAGAHVRLYVLWGYGATAMETWAARLHESVAWSCARAVETVSICPYVPPMAGLASSEALADVGPLHRLVHALRPGPRTTVEIVENGLASCAPHRSGVKP